MSRSDVIIIIAGGPSVGSYDLSALYNKGLIIGVNDAFLKFPGCHMGASMDRLWTEARIHEIKKLGKPFATRFAAIKFILDKCADVDHIMPHDCDEVADLSDAPGKINGTSSGMFALNWAVQMAPKKIYLLGFDMGRSPGKTPYWYETYKWVSAQGGTKDGRYARWCREFEIIAAQCRQKNIKVVNVNHMSALKCFPVMSYKGLIYDTFV